MKHRFIRFLCYVMCLCCALPVWAQGTVSVVSSGKASGSVISQRANNTTYVDVQKMARKLGAGVQLYAQSKQVKVTAKNFYAILTAGDANALVNAHTEELAAPVEVYRNVLMVPVDFFLLPAFQQAVGKEISFSKGTLYVERPYDFARTANEVNAAENKLVFSARKPLTWQTLQPNKHTVEVLFPNAVIKRDENFRFHTDYISTVAIRQTGEGAKIKVILGKKAAHWAVIRQNGQPVLRVGANPVIEPAPQLTGVEPSPVQEEPAPQTPSIVQEDVQDSPETAQSLPAIPVIKAAQPAIKEETTQPVPVIKATVPTQIKAAHKKMRIVVDPGHGGKDPGAQRGKYREKDWNLAVAKELAKLLKKGGFEVKMTREDDRFLALSERSKIATNFKADLFISIHTNASKKSSANGFQVYFRSEKASDKEAASVAALENEAMQYEEVHYNFVDALLQSLAKNEYINESSKLAGYVRNAVYKQPGIGIGVNQNNSVLQANFYVLKGVQSPAILVEMGYISSPKDRARLSTAGPRGKMAQGIYNGIVNYAKKEGWMN